MSRTAIRHPIRALVLVSMLSMLHPAPARADSFWSWWFQDWFTRRDSKNGLISPQTETDALKSLRQKYLDQHPNLRNKQVASAAINGITDVSALLDGAVAFLTFDWLVANPTNPTIGSVQYWANYDPDLMDPTTSFDIFAGLTLLGTSTDAASHFSFATVIQGFEPLYLAVPFDENGVAFNFDGVEDPIGSPHNVALGFVTNIPASVPEPSTLILFATGAIAIGTTRRLRQKQAWRRRSGQD